MAITLMPIPGNLPLDVPSRSAAALDRSSPHARRARPKAGGPGPARRRPGRLPRVRRPVRAGPDWDLGSELRLDAREGSRCADPRPVGAVDRDERPPAAPDDVGFMALLERSPSGACSFLTRAYSYESRQPR